MAKLTDLTLDEHNANLGTKRGREMLAESLREYGAGRSILVDKEGRVISGNKTVQQAIEVGIEDLLVVETDGRQLVAVKRLDLNLEDGGKARALAYFDNRVGQLDLDWNPDQLLADFDTGLDLSGLFGKDELDELLRGITQKEPPEDPGPQTNRAEELQEKWQVSQGDIWQCGNDLWLICGDCRESEVWQQLLDAASVEKVNGVFTSPPYAEQRKKQYSGIPTDKYVDWWEAVQENVRANLASDGSFFVNIKPHCKDGERVLYVMDLVLAMKRWWDWQFVDELCWTHQGVPGSWNNRFKNGFEPIYQFVRGRARFRPGGVSVRKETAFRGKGGGLASYYDPDNAVEHSTRSFLGDVLPSNTLRFNFPSAATEFTGHGAQFPVALPDFFIRAYSDPGDTWIDNFMGSGTTGVAAYQNKRRFVGIEVLEKYCAVTLERWQDLTNRQPQLLKV